jgi:hypothetical protein
MNNETQAEEVIWCASEDIRLMSQIISSLPAVTAAPSLWAGSSLPIAFEELVRVVNASSLPSLNMINPCIGENCEPNFLRKIRTDRFILFNSRDRDMIVNSGLFIQKLRVEPTLECWDVMTGAPAIINIQELEFLFYDIFIFDPGEDCQLIMDGLYSFLASETGRNISRVTFIDNADHYCLFDEVPFLPLVSALGAYVNTIQSLGDECYIERYTIARVSTQNSSTSVDWADWAVVHLTFEELKMNSTNMTALADAFPFLENIEIESRMDTSAPEIHEDEVGSY